MTIKEGIKVPNFSLPNQEEKIVSSELLLGNKYILFFYPKDDTPGCTKEACSMRDNFNAITKMDYKIFGISPDKSKKHDKFINKYEFQFDLLADTEKKMINDFGLWGTKKFMGREIEGVFRTTVLVNEEGIIQKIISKVVTKSHGEQVLQAIDAL